jgi:hypothetical protein
MQETQSRLLRYLTVNTWKIPQRRAVCVHTALWTKVVISSQISISVCYTTRNISDPKARSIPMWQKTFPKEFARVCWCLECSLISSFQCALVVALLHFTHTAKLRKLASASFASQMWLFQTRYWVSGALTFYYFHNILWNPQLTLSLILPSIIFLIMCTVGNAWIHNSSGIRALLVAVWKENRTIIAC